MSEKLETKELQKPHENGDDTVCKDYDEDCEDVRCKTTCWLYQPEKGLCPYLKGKT